MLQESQGSIYRFSSLGGVEKLRNTIHGERVKNSLEKQTNKRSTSILICLKSPSPTPPPNKKNLTDTERGQLD